MFSRFILLTHTAIFGSLVVGSLGSPVLNLLYPEEFSQYFLWAVGVLILIIISSWFMYGGDCPLTVWENNARKREGRPTYKGSCIDHHAKLWFGWTPPRSFSTIVPVGVLLVPLIVGIFF